MMRTVLRHRFSVGGFHLPSRHHCQEADLPGGYPRRIKLSFPCASKRWRALFIELIIRMVQIWNFQGSYQLRPKKHQMLSLGIPGGDHISRNTGNPKTLTKFQSLSLGHAIANGQRLSPKTKRPPPVLWEELPNFYIGYSGEVCPDGVAEGIPGGTGIWLNPRINGTTVRAMHRGSMPDGKYPAAGVFCTSALYGAASFRVF